MYVRYRNEFTKGPVAQKRWGVVKSETVEEKRLEAGRAEVSREQGASFQRGGIHLERTAWGQVPASGQSASATAERRAQGARRRG